MISFKYLRQDLIMGSNHSDSQGQIFRKQDWGVIERSETSSTWQNLRDPTQRIQQYVLYSASQQEYKQQKQIYYMRKHHPQVVAALYLSSQSSHDFCSSTYQQKLFIQKIPIRLADIEHIPFPDYLHIYSQALKGYSYLSTYIGYFPVEQDYIGINQKAVVKVWMNPDLSKHQVIGHRVSQEVMIRTIIQIVDKNIDRTQTSIPSVKDYIYQKTDKATFQEAIGLLNNFIQEYNSGITPQKLQCIDKVGGIYAIANRDKTLNTQILKQQHQQEQIQATNSRPRLVDSQILNQLQYPVGQVQNQTIPSSQIVPNSQTNILTPSTVRQNVPIVRRQLFVGNNNNSGRFQGNVHPIQMLPFQKNIYKQQQKFQQYPQPLVFNTHIFPQQQQQQQQHSQQAFVQRINPVINQNSQIRVLQNIPPQGYPQKNNYNNQQNIIPIYNQQPPNINSNQIVSNIVPFEKSLIVQTAKQPQLPNFKKLESNNQQQTIFPQFRPSALKDNSEISNYISKPYSQVTPNIPIQQTNPLPSFTDFNKQKGVTESTHTINIDDGKSPSDFFNRLNQFSSMEGMRGLKYPPQSNEPFYNTVDLTAYQYKNPFSSHNQNTNIYQKQAEQPQKANVSQQNFGKSAVSDIIQGGYETNYSYDKIKEPLKFENNLDMKYSMFQTEQAQFQPSYTYKKYQTSYDPQLLQDINNLRQ